MVRWTVVSRSQILHLVSHSQTLSWESLSMQDCVCTVHYVAMLEYMTSFCTISENILLYLNWVWKISNVDHFTIIWCRTLYTLNCSMFNYTYRNCCMYSYIRTCTYYNNFMFSVNFTYKSLLHVATILYIMSVCIRICRAAITSQRVWRG